MGVQEKIGNIVTAKRTGDAYTRDGTPRNEIVVQGTNSWCRNEYLNSKQGRAEFGDEE